jgi:hypothetical protein
MQNINQPLKEIKMKKNTRKSSFATVAKNIETMISIDLSVGLDFEITKLETDKTTFRPIVGTKTVCLEDFLKNPVNVMSLLDEPPKATKKILKMINQHQEDYQYAAVVFKLLKQKITEPLDCVRSIQFEQNESGPKTLKFELHHGIKLRVVVDMDALNSISVKG